jgi:hypothetical protein
MSRSPTLLLRRLFSEPPMLELPLDASYAHAQYEVGIFRVATQWRFRQTKGRQLGGSFCNYYRKISRLVGCGNRIRTSVYPVTLAE